MIFAHVVVLIRAGLERKELRLKNSYVKRVEKNLALMKAKLEIELKKVAKLDFAQENVCIRKNKVTDYEYIVK